MRQDRKGEHFGFLLDINLSSIMLIKHYAVIGFPVQTTLPVVIERNKVVEDVRRIRVGGRGSDRWKGTRYRAMDARHCP